MASAQAHQPGRCTACAGLLTAGGCPACSRAGTVTLLNREILLLVTLTSVVLAGFFATRAAARQNHQRRLIDAGHWYSIGERHLAAGVHADAVAALRRATVLAPDDRIYRFALAAALAADRQDESARAVLLGIRDAAPEDPEVNLRLARLEARRGDLAAATRYYQSALHGAWAADAQADRRRVRLELIRYLLGHGERPRALSELLVLSGNLPDDVESQTEAAGLFLEAGDARRALDHYRRALRSDGHASAALSGAAEAAFAAADYGAADRYLRALADTGTPAAGRLAHVRTLTDLVLTRDPLARALSARERIRRLAADAADAAQILDACTARLPDPNVATAQTLRALRAHVGELLRGLHRSRSQASTESIESGLETLLRVADAVSPACTPPPAILSALVLIGRRHDIGPA